MARSYLIELLRKRVANPAAFSDFALATQPGQCYAPNSHCCLARRGRK